MATKSEIPCHGSLENDETGLLEFTVSLGGSPNRIVFDEAADERTKLIGNLRSAATPS